jgi:formylglycine-generating enzyme required for sulfatase activity/serine/threonine protein kinase
LLDPSPASDEPPRPVGSASRVDPSRDRPASGETINVFVSYRREDSLYQSGRLFDRLVAHFGSERVFRDIDSIPLGEDFREVLTERVAGCDAFLAVIGDTWLSVTGKRGIRRLDDPGDFVRIEIEAALSRRIPVIPVLVGRSSVPQAEELPEDLRALSFRNGLPVRPDPDFHNDMDRLIRGIEDGVSALRARPAPRETRSPGPQAEKTADKAASLDLRARSSTAIEEPGETSRPPPEKFGRYRIIKRLGPGSMGSVYLAEDTQLERQVALKAPDFGPEVSPEARKRFVEEARAAASLDHPYLCPVLDVGEIDGRLYLTRAYIEGQSLAELTRGRRLPPRQAASLLGKLALAMRAAHERNVVHRGLKPANILFKTTGERREPVIVDFGQVPWDNPEAVRVMLRRATGTLAYMAPEQIRGELKEIPACDIYALGAILYELLTGRLPFGGSGPEVAGRSLTSAPLPPSAHRSELDPVLDAICLKAMATRVGDRYASMDELATALRTFLSPPSVTPTPGAPAAPAPPSAQPRPPATSRSPVGRLPEQSGEKKASPLPSPAKEPVALPSPSPERRRRRWPMIVAAAVLGLFLLGVIIYVETDKGRIRMVINDPKAVVKIDGKAVRVEAPGEPITLRAGEHALEVTWGDGQFQTRQFIVRRGDDECLRVEYEPTRKSEAVAEAKKPEMAAKPGTDRERTPPKVATEDIVRRKEAAPPARRARSPARGRDSTVPPRQITNSIGMTLMLIPAGEFMMGSPDSDKDANSNEKPQHRVRITRPFYLGATEVTRGQFRRFVDEAGYQTEAKKNGKGNWGWNEEKKTFEQNPRYTWQNPGFKQDDEHPVVNVSWNDAVAFASWLSRKEGPTYRLPTEAEWEYACRARATTKYASGDDPESLAAVANIADGTAKAKYPDWTTIAARDGYIYTAPVGRYKPNAWGLFDMHGNVWEWCSDGFAADYYKGSPVDDPRGAEGASSRVFRGGGWNYVPRLVRSAIRNKFAPGDRSGGLGFRLARVQSVR